jgi:hypothetical protein
MGFPAGFGIVHILNLSGPGFHGGKGFCEYGPLAGNVCVIHTIPNSFFLSD